MATTPTAEPVDEVRSWARRSGDRLHLVLRMPGLALERGTEPTVELRRGGTTVTATAEVTSTTDGTTLTVDLLAADLRAGTWALTMRLQGADERRHLEARVLLPRRGPVALSTGPTPGTPLRPRPHGGTLVSRATHMVGKATDVALRELPPERAVQYRRALRRVARTVRS